MIDRGQPSSRTGWAMLALVLLGFAVVAWSLSGGNYPAATPSEGRPDPADGGEAGGKEAGRREGDTAARRANPGDGFGARQLFGTIQLLEAGRLEPLSGIEVLAVGDDDEGHSAVADERGVISLACGEYELRSARAPPAFAPTHAVVGDTPTSIELPCLGYLRIESGAAFAVLSMAEDSAELERILGASEPLAEVGDMVRSGALQVGELQVGELQVGDPARSPLATSGGLLPLATSHDYYVVAFHDQLTSVTPPHPDWDLSSVAVDAGVRRTEFPSRRSEICPVSAPLRLQPGEVKPVGIELGGLVDLQLHLADFTPFPQQGVLALNRRLQRDRSVFYQRTRDIVIRDGLCPEVVTIDGLRPGGYSVAGLLWSGTQVRAVYDRGEVEAGAAGEPCDWNLARVARPHSIDVHCDNLQWSGPAFLSITPAPGHTLEGLERYFAINTAVPSLPARFTIYGVPACKCALTVTLADDAGTRVDGVSDGALVSSIVF